MLEDLLLTALNSCSDLTSMLGSYAKQPAIFYQTAPSINDEAWGEVKYPHIVYCINYKHNQKRNIDGLVSFVIYTLDDETSASVQVIGTAVRSALRDLFLTTNSSTFTLAWENMHSININSKATPCVIANKLSFKLIAFPVHQKTSPDPLEGLSLWLKSFVPSCRVIGVDSLNEIAWATHDIPFICVRLLSDGCKMRNSYCVSWMDALLAIHVFSPNVISCNYLCRNILNALSFEGEILLSDNSIMLIKNAAISASGDAFYQGQLTVSGEYAIPRVLQPESVLNHVYTEGRFETRDN